MYVDDNILVSDNRPALDAFKKILHDKYEIVDKGPIAYYLGVEIVRDRALRTLKIHQSKYLADVLKSVGIDESCTTKYDTPLPAGIHLSANDGAMYERDLYRSLVGSLIYLSIWTRPDIAYAVSVLSKHMQNPARDHHVAMRHVLLYLNGTRDLGITYHGHDPLGTCTLYGFCDADFAGNPDTRRSRSGWVYMLCGAALSWRSKTQSVCAISTADSEMYAAVAAVKECKYLRDQLARLGLYQSDPTVLFEDNRATLAIATNGSYREATKHLGNARAFLRYHNENGTVELTDCYTEKQNADMFTKSLGRIPFNSFRDLTMGVIVPGNQFYYERMDWRKEYERKHAAKYRQEEVFVNGNFET